MQDFTDIIKRKFPTDRSKGFYVRPHQMPATKVGKLLMKHTDIARPDEVIALHEYGGFFGGGMLAFTGTHCYYPEGKFPLEDLRSAHQRDSGIEVQVNQGGQMTQHLLKADDSQAAKLLVNVLDGIIYQPKADDLLAEERSYEGLNKAEIDWLKLRDEIMRTIDQLHQRFQDGKLSLDEYENKKTDLLDRL
jgi:hypothetical protein